jgi:glycosyltransferase involved in cell wall biosynthesis
MSAVHTPLKILCVGYRVPYPVRDGGNVRAYGCLRELGRRHEVWYLCRADAPRPDAEQHLRAFCRVVEIVADPVRLTWTGRLRALAGRYPFGVITPADAFFQRFRAVLGQQRFDLIYPVGADAALLAAEAVAATAVVWDLCDCTSRYYERQARGAGSPWRAWWYRAQSSRYRRLEQDLLQRDLAVLVASPSEAQALRGAAGSGPGRITVLPTGVGPAPPAVPHDGPARLAFLGTLGYPPNADAVLHFCREVLPRVQREHPDVRFQIIGDGASSELSLACRAVPGVEFLGFVPDVLEVLRRATVFVCPMRQGTGIKVKLLEAMACGLPIVASPVAVEGVPEARDGHHLRIATSADDFSHRIVELLRDAPRRKELGDRARELAARYTWDRLGERLDGVCRDEVARRRGGGADQELGACPGPVR